MSTFWKCASEALKKQVYRQHTQGISRKSLASNFRKSDSTIARYYDHMYDLENRKLRTLQIPRMLGIDEHFFSRRRRFATTFCDLKKRRIFDVASGRSNAALRAFSVHAGSLQKLYLFAASRIFIQEPAPTSWNALSPYLNELPGKNRVRIICMDLSESCRAIARNWFPSALVVADRFHVVRLALHRLMKTCRLIDPDLIRQRGLARLLQKHACNLTQKQDSWLSDYLASQPAVASIYGFKEELMAMLKPKKQSKDQCRILERIAGKWAPVPG